MTDGAREEYAAALRPHYRLADKAQRGRRLDEYCRVTGSPRQAAIRALRRAPRDPSGARAGRAPLRP